MSILINIETPDGCYNCPLFRIVSTQKTITAIPLIQYTKAFCLALKTEFLNETNIAVRPSDCPIIEVPTPHGRLIDADALLVSENWHYEYHSDSFYVETRTIELAPTIIETDIDVMYYPQVDGITPTVIKTKAEEL